MQPEGSPVRQFNSCENLAQVPLLRSWYLISKKFAHRKSQVLDCFESNAIDTGRQRQGTIPQGSTVRCPPSGRFMVVFGQYMLLILTVQRSSNDARLNLATVAVFCLIFLP